MTSCIIFLLCSSRVLTPSILHSPGFFRQPGSFSKLTKAVPLSFLPSLSSGVQVSGQSPTSASAHRQTEGNFQLFPNVGGKKITSANILKKKQNQTTQLGVSTGTLQTPQSTGRNMPFIRSLICTGKAVSHSSGKAVRKSHCHPRSPC